MRSGHLTRPHHHAAPLRLFLFPPPPLFSFPFLSFNCFLCSVVGSVPPPCARVLTDRASPVAGGVRRFASQCPGRTVLKLRLVFSKILLLSADPGRCDRTRRMSNRAARHTTNPHSNTWHTFTHHLSFPFLCISKTRASTNGLLFVLTLTAFPPSRRRLGVLSSQPQRATAPQTRDTLPRPTLKHGA